MLLTCVQRRQTAETTHLSHTMICRMTSTGSSTSLRRVASTNPCVENGITSAVRWPRATQGDGAPQTWLVGRTELLILFDSKCIRFIFKSEEVHAADSNHVGQGFTASGPHHPTGNPHSGDHTRSQR